VIELLAGLVLSLTAAVVGVWQVTKRDRPLHGPLDDGTLGLPRLQRWDVSYQPPRMQRLRSRFPRIEISRVVIVLCLLIGIAASTAFWFSRSSSRSASQQEAFMLGLSEVTTLRQQAAATRSQSEAYALLIRAQNRIDEVGAQGSTDTDHAAIALEDDALIAALERVTNVVHLSSVRVVGTVPKTPRGGDPQLVSGGGQTYLLADAVYHVQTAGATLVRMLGEGDIVPGTIEPVGRISALTWRDNALLAVDATRAYAFEPATGIWSVEVLAGVDATGYVETMAAETFDRNLYLLAPENGQILKFSAGIYDSEPEDWNGAVARDDLKSAVDLAINGHVYVALEDGRVLDFYRARLEGTFEPRVLPPIERASSIVVPAASDLLYMLSETDGRILRISADGRLLQQIVPPANAPMTGATDITVDAASGVALIVSNDTLYLLRLPTPPAVEAPTETPSPEPPPLP